ncbi:SUMF1/EgtB/PvdO family nonheme iron enzyme [Bacteroides sp. OttesenSCG-928-D19]|nr:SUMF1/EgtB/PvdO family nonheme iron enzyme [Bacteroides sp. OttesenSCG-928-D19]
MQKEIKHKETTKKPRKLLIICIGVVLGVLIALPFNYIYIKSSQDESCMVCHVHPHAEDSWRLSTHYNGKSGVKVSCVKCHLPPEGTFKHTLAKMQTGMKDVWSYMFKDTADIDWEAKKELAYAQKIVYNESCLDCHVQLFPSSLSEDGITAHFYYEQNAKKLDLQCISCHMDVGHYNPNYSHSKMAGIPVQEEDNGEIYTQPAQVTAFEDYTEFVPGTSVTFEMKAIPGGTFKMGSPDKESLREPNEGPQINVQVSPFFMAETEVTWKQYWAFYAETMSEARTPPEVVYANNSRDDVDVITGPTAPFGNPEQGWGGGNRPAITMTHYAAETFCQWLSKKTGKKYRLPTEAEWEYAARGGSETPYFFEGDPKKFSDKGFWRKFFKADTTMINRYITYVHNSRNRTQEGRKLQPNPFGLKSMLGNVMEYTSDWYADDYAHLQDGILNPKGPQSGTERVVRGGYYADDAANVRSASRRATEHDNWMRTDPQQPKSIWWYSDIKGIGFRVVCEPE